MLDPSRLLEVESLLDADESLLWAGAPRQGLVLRPTDAFMVPFSILWGGFAIFWEAGVLASGAPWFFALWGVPFVLIGLYFMIGRFFVDARARARTLYALTDHRAIIISGLLSKSTRSLPLRTLSDVSLIERRDGSGTIRLGPSPPLGNWDTGLQWPGMGQHASPAFELIPNAKQVHEQVLTAHKAAA